MGARAQMGELDYGWTDAVPESTDYLNPVVLRLARETGARSVIDAGCGNGVLANLLQKNGFSVRGFDADAGGVAIARQQYPHVPFTVGTFEDSPGEPVDLWFRPKWWNTSMPRMTSAVSASPRLGRVAP